MENSIRNFFYPKTICIAGASTKELSIGYKVLKNIKQFNYSATILPVNPTAKSIFGIKCYSSITKINVQIDLAIVLVPKRFVLETIDDLLVKGVKSIILITAGFKETGKEGEELESKILEKIKKGNARLVGPNCMGVIETTETNLNATFISEMPKKGSVAFLSQSGALGATILNSLRESDINFAHFISVGNKADLNENDFLQYWQGDKNISVLTYYLESFDNGLEFIKPFFLSKAGKPTIVLKAGNTVSGMKAASSHTGALSSEDRVVDSLLKQAGEIRVDDIKELFNTAKGFESFPLPKGNRVAIVTNAGGPAILLTDKLDKEGMVLGTLSDETKSELKKIVHPEGSVNNPIDLLPLGNEATYTSVINILLEDDNIDIVISLFVEPGFINPISIAAQINEIKSEKPILQVIMPKPEFWDKYRKLPTLRKPVFRNPEEPAEIIANMLFYSNKKKQRADTKNEIIELLQLNNKNIFSYTSGFIGQIEIRKICDYYNFPIVNETLIPASEISLTKIEFYPVVIKGISKDVIHKSEFDAVKLNIKNSDELIIAANEIAENFEKNNYSVTEFLIQEFIDTKHEILLGGYRDASFGPAIMFGSGGKYVEVLNDTAIRSAYISKSEIREMILSTSMGQILAGVRGEKSIDINSLVEIMQSTSKMLIENDGILELDFNPIIVDTKNKLHAVDVRIKFK
jgi:acetyltransferase